MRYRSDGRFLRPMARIDGTAADLNEEKYSGFERRLASVPVRSNSAKRPNGQNETKEGSLIEFCADIGMDFGLAPSKWPKRTEWMNLDKFSVVYGENIKLRSHSITGKSFCFCVKIQTIMASYSELLCFMRDLRRSILDITDCD
jgi:hypothetical protein